jgi:lipid-binding SYLF domain-containing protein
MKKFNASLLFFILFIVLFITDGYDSFAQTEGFDVKTPIETIADNTTKFLGEIMKDSENSIPREMICNAECYLIVPSVVIDTVRSYYDGTGLLSCRTSDSGKLETPLFYNITNLDTFNEDGGGLIIFVTDRQGVKAALGDQVQLTAENTAAGKAAKNEEMKSVKSFIAYTKQPEETIKGIDLTGSTLVYSSGYTFKAYQQTLDPIDEMLLSIDTPPVLRGFMSLLTEWTKGCK